MQKESKRDLLVYRFCEWKSLIHYPWFKHILFMTKRIGRGFNPQAESLLFDAVLLLQPIQIKEVGTVFQIGDLKHDKSPILTLYVQCCPHPWTTLFMLMSLVSTCI